jgi:hypothetical protein
VLTPAVRFCTPANPALWSTDRIQTKFFSINQLRMLPAGVATGTPVASEDSVTAMTGAVR